MLIFSFPPLSHLTFPSPSSPHPPVTAPVSPSPRPPPRSSGEGLRPVPTPQPRPHHINACSHRPAVDLDRTPRIVAGGTFAPRGSHLVLPSSTYWQRRRRLRLPGHLPRVSECSHTRPARHSAGSVRLPSLVSGVHGRVQRAGDVDLAPPPCSALRGCWGFALIRALVHTIFGGVGFRYPSGALDLASGKGLQPHVRCPDCHFGGNSLGIWGCIPLLDAVDFFSRFWSCYRFPIPLCCVLARWRWLCGDSSACRL